MESIVLGPWPVIHIANIALPTYYVIISLVLTLTTWYVYKRAEFKQYSGTTAMDLYLIGLIAGVFGARLMHIFYEAPEYYRQNPLEVFYFWQGGFVFYGGAIATFLSGMVALKIKKQSFPMWLDFFAPVASLGYGLGRIACFLAGCCYGRACDLPWAFPFTSVQALTGVTTIVYRHPVQLYATVLELITFAFILYVEKKKSFTSRPGSVFITWMALHSVARILIETFRDDDRGPALGGFSISTRISFFILIAILFYYRNQRRRHQRH